MVVLMLGRREEIETTRQSLAAGSGVTVFVLLHSFTESGIIKLNISNPHDLYTILIAA
jgi:hypothetical protein